jgi:DNA invertase Pin-like site-specific DNA recombinase
VLPEDASIGAYFWDIESGRMELADRGRSRAHENFDITVPRDGGLVELMAEAALPGRRFDYVICEDIGRAGRRSRLSSQLEYDLEQLGVTLVAADEPIMLKARRRKGPSSTQVLTRRVKQGATEWYVLEMLEKSWGGFETHTEQGFNIGKPCYGFRAVTVAHPVPAKRAKGIKKSRLAAHPVESATVATMFAWRTVERIGYQHIADRLNTDLTTNPPPIPVDPARAVGIWTYSSVREVLTNPKHTGHMVWNRHARKNHGRNRINPVTDWVWSSVPTHDQVVDLATFIAAQHVSGHRERSRSAPGPRRAAPTQTVYALRSYLFCQMCGRRMHGKTKRGRRYYVCAPKKAWLPDGHPPSTFWIREHTLLAAIGEFLAGHVFGQYRRALLDAELADISAAELADRDTTIRALRAAIETTHTTNKKLLRTLELTDEADIDRDLIRHLNQRRAELRAERDQLTAQLDAALAEVERQPNPELLDQLPHTPGELLDLTALPDPLRRQLFDALQLQIRYHHRDHHASCAVTLCAGTITTVAAIAADIAGQHPAPDAPDTPITARRGQLPVTGALQLPERPPRHPAHDQTGDPVGAVEAGAATPPRDAIRR